MPTGSASSSTADGAEARRLTLRPRLFDTRNAANLLSEEVDHQPDPGNAHASGTISMLSGTGDSE